MKAGRQNDAIDPAARRPRGDRYQFLAVVAAQVIKDLKVAAAEKEKSASGVLEEAAREWLKRNKKR